jgi:hypothetical protein
MLFERTAERDAIVLQSWLQGIGCSATPADVIAASSRRFVRNDIVKNFLAVDVTATVHSVPSIRRKR